MLLAGLVILSHSPELVDGNRSREILTRIFGTLSFGELAVDGFFLISGYLIVKSFQTSASVWAYLRRRMLRIYPAFVVASLFGILVVAPLSGGDLAKVSPGTVLTTIASLSEPSVPNAFAGLHYPALNGSMWTIGYEFRCYLITIAMGWLAVRNRRLGYAVALTGITTLYLFRDQLPVPPSVRWLAPLPAEMVRLAFAFFAGGAFYVWRDRISYTTRGALLAGAALIPLMFFKLTAEPALVVLGGYLAFWFVFAYPPTGLSKAMDHTDPSYGVYLYAWPIQSLMIFYAPGISPWTVSILTLFASVGLGLLSWRFIEKPALRLNALSTEGQRRIH